MTPAYAPTYLADAETCLATAFDYAVYDCRVPADLFADLFARSSLSRQFGQGNPAVVAGMSGLDLAYSVLEPCGLLDEEPEPTYTRGLSPEYWAGQALAHYQWSRGYGFADIFARVPFSRIVEFYHPLHEASTSIFVEQLDRLLVEASPAHTNLARLRTVQGLSQSQLARASHVGLKSIQAYEQRVNSINKASGETLRRLAAVLRCSIEQLLEFEPLVTEPHFTVEYLSPQDTDRDEGSQ